MKRFLRIVSILAAVSVPAWSPAAGDDGTVGVVRNVAGTATVSRGENVLPATAGTRLRVGDTLSTGADGSMGVLLRDNASLSLGPGSRLVLREFLFAPSEGKLGLFVRFSRGTMAYISGLIGKLAPEKTRFETPTATIGIRGTFFAVNVQEPAAE